MGEGELLNATHPFPEYRGVRRGTRFEHLHNFFFFQIILHRDIILVQTCVFVNDNNTIRKLAVVRT